MQSCVKRRLDLNRVSYLNRRIHPEGRLPLKRYSVVRLSVAICKYPPRRLLVIWMRLRRTTVYLSGPYPVTIYSAYRRCVQGALGPYRLETGLPDSVHGVGRARRLRR